MAKKSVAVTSEAEYPLWRILVWRFVRAGVAGGISALLAVQIVLQPDLANIKVYSSALASAFLAGFISAAGLAVREFISGGDKEAAIQKLPV